MDHFSFFVEEFRREMVKGQERIFLVNPDKQEVEFFAQRKKIDEYRGIIDTDNVVYLWDAYYLTHTDVIHELGISPLVVFYIDMPTMRFLVSKFHKDQEQAYQKAIRNQVLNKILN